MCKRLDEGLREEVARSKTIVESKGEELVLEILELRLCPHFTPADSRSDRSGLRIPGVLWELQLQFYTEGGRVRDLFISLEGGFQGHYLTYCSPVGEIAPAPPDARSGSGLGGSSMLLSFIVYLYRFAS